MSACDRANDASILLRNHQIGAYVRSLKQWVLVPTDLTYCDLLDLLNHIAYDACSERWERLPRLTELSMVKTPWYHVTARTAVRTAPTLVQLT